MATNKILHQEWLDLKNGMNIGQPYQEWLENKIENKNVSSILLDEIIKYIETTEEGIEFERGCCRNVKQLLKDKDMPAIYYEFIKLKER